MFSMPHLMIFSRAFGGGSRGTALAALYFYRTVLSLERGFLGVAFKMMLPYGFVSSGCRFFPSCSAYAEDAVRQYGLLNGSVLFLHRILRCGPWSEGGYDPVK